MNDTSLRKLCEKEGVPILWGLQLLLELHQSGGITVPGALAIAREIHKTNPKHITAKIVERFTTTIKKQQE